MNVTKMPQKAATSAMIPVRLCMSTPTCMHGRSARRGLGGSVLAAGGGHATGACQALHEHLWDVISWHAQRGLHHPLGSPGKAISSSQTKSDATRSNQQQSEVIRHLRKVEREVVDEPKDGKGRADRDEEPRPPEERARLVDLVRARPPAIGSNQKQSEVIRSTPRRSRESPTTWRDRPRSGGRASEGPWKLAWR